MITMLQARGIRSASMRPPYMCNYTRSAAIVKDESTRNTKG